MPFPRIPEFNEGGDERWLITYADMITLLLVLFIILYSTANADLQVFLAMGDIFGAGSEENVGLGAPTGPFEDGGISPHPGPGTSPIELFPKHQIPIDIMQFYRIMQGTGEGDGEGDGGLEGEIQDILEQAEQIGIDEGIIPEEGLGVDIEVTFNERGINIIIFPSDILFDSGSARLKPTFEEILARLYDPFSRLPNKIEIQGHTDSIPINTAAYPSNWELSAGRAGSVIRYLESLGLPAWRLQAAGYADTVPVADNTTREGRAKNRRVELLVLRGIYPVDPALLERIEEAAETTGERAEEILDAVGGEFVSDEPSAPAE